MRRSPAAGPGSPGCPDLLRHVGGPRSPRSPLSPLFLSFFEEECRAIASRLRLAAAPEPAPGPGPGPGGGAAGSGSGGESALWPDAAGPVTSTPLPRGRAAAAPAPAARVPPSPARGGSRRGGGQRPPSGGRGAARLPRGAPGPQLPQAGERPGAPATRLPAPAGRPGARTLRLDATRAKAGDAAWERERGVPGGGAAAAVKAGGPRQPPRRLSTAIPAAASRSRLRPPGKVASPKRFCLSKGSTTRQLACNVTRGAKASGESAKQLAATWTVPGAGKADQTWVCAGSPSPSELLPGPTSGCGDVAPAEQSAGDELSRELERVKSELERVKSELADRAAQCEAYRRTVACLRARLRAAGAWPDDAVGDETGVSGRD